MSDTESKHHPHRAALIIAACLGLCAALVVAGFYYRNVQAKKTAEEARRATASLCVIQNDNRAALRRTTLALFSVITARLRYDPPRDFKTQAVFAAQVDLLQRQLRALRPIDCAKYVRPEYIPPVPVESPQEESP